MGRINKTRINFKVLDNLIKDLGRNVSIKVGIIGDKATQIHKGTKLTNAELGTIHEFGATITVTDKMRNYLHSQGIHLKKDTTTIEIPSRSFLRDSILSSEGKAAIRKEVMSKEYIKESISNDRELNKLAWSKDNYSLMEAIGYAIAIAAHDRVMGAFETEGFGNWPPTTPASKQMRKYNKNEPTLVDTGDLERSITYEVKIK